MDRVNAICRHPEYISKMEAIRQAESGRIYCCHDTEHLLDVARIMYIRNLEEGAGFDKELIYAAALLHDIGRADQYESGMSHDEAGAKTAGVILADCGFESDEIGIIKEAISGHRGDFSSGEMCSSPDSRDGFSMLLKEADKLSRLCFKCEARESCKWPDEKKNMEIII